LLSKAKATDNPTSRRLFQEKPALDPDKKVCRIGGIPTRTPTTRHAGYKNYSCSSPPPPNKALRLTVVHVNKKGKTEEKPVLLPAEERTVHGLLVATRKKFRISLKKALTVQSTQGQLLCDVDIATGMNDGTKVLVLITT
jgi:hypothetical protein